MKIFETLDDNIVLIDGVKYQKVEEEQKEVPKIKCIQVTRTIFYDPESYLEECLENNITPSQSGFLKYMEGCFDDDFVLSHFYEQEIKELDVWN